MPDTESKLNRKEIDLLVKAIAAGKDPREMLLLAAYLGIEAAGKSGAEDVDLDDPTYVPSTRVAGAMDAALRRFRVNERTATRETNTAFRKAHNIPPPARHV